MQKASPEEIDWGDDSWEHQPLDISKAPDFDRVREAISDAVAFEMYDGDGWDPTTQMQLWQRVDDVYAEETGRPKSQYPFGGFRVKMNYHDALAEQDPSHGY